MVSLQELDNSNMVDYKFFYLLPLMLSVWGITIFQTQKFFVKSEGNRLKKLKQYMTSPVARDYIGISVFGFCSGALYLIFGSSWNYTHFIKNTAIILFDKGIPDTSVFPILITTLALMLGIAFASTLSKDFKLSKGKPKDFLIKIFAGGLMGFGAGLIPGGNDTLILHGIPGVALHAPVALIIMMGSIAAMALIKKGFK